MRHLTALVIKYLMIALVLGVILGLAGGASLSQILVVSAILTVIAYVIGDLMILPATENWIAVAADAAIAWAVLRYALPLVATGGRLLFSVIAIGIGEYFFHMYVRESILQKTPTFLGASAGMLTPMIEEELEVAKRNL